MTYSVKDLGTVAGFSTEPADINNGGVIVGTLRGSGTSVPFTWGSSSGITQLSTLGGATVSEARAINNRGEVAGMSNNQVVQWDAVGAITALAPPPMPMTFAHDINDAGSVAGGYIVAGPQEHPRVFQSGKPSIDPTNSLGIWDEGLGLNNASPPIVVGTTMIGSGTSTHGFSWAVGGAMVDLTPGPASSAARAINLAGDIVGENGANAVIFRKAGTVDAIPTLGGFNSGSAKDINGPGEVVGDSSIFGVPGPTAPFLFRAFRREASGSTNVPPEVVDLNTLIPAGSGWVLEHAVAINDSGWIVGTGQLSGAQRGFVLIPPATSGGGCLSVMTLLIPAAVAGLILSVRRLVKNG